MPGLMGLALPRRADEPPEFIDSEFGTLYFWMLVAADIFVVLLLLSVLGGLVSHLCDPMPAVLRARRSERCRDRTRGSCVSAATPSTLSHPNGLQMGLQMSPSPMGSLLDDPDPADHPTVAGKSLRSSR